MDSSKVVAGQGNAQLGGEPKTVVSVEAGAQVAPESAAEPSASAKVKEPAGPRGIESLKPGMRVKGKVRKVLDFGAFVDIGVGRDGLVHISALKRAGIEKKIRVGQVLDVVVRRVRKEDRRISLTIPNRRGESKTRLQDLRVDSVVSGRVVRLVDFGAFVDIGARTDGLLHVSQLPWGYVNHPSEVLEVGDEIQVRILGVDPGKRRISLSMREPEDDVASRQPARTAESHDRVPTAFEVAFQDALTDRRRRRRRAPR